ncbi:MAG: MnhB domain-containing protein [Desulfobacterales bacterium]|nr:MnhB domain-containing protein [Desulfobacterales bacterium]
MKRFGLITVFLCGAILLYGAADFPGWSDPAAPANRRLAAYYIHHTLAETSVPNIVTAILADYRGYDTMFETTVIFSAAVACFFLLRQIGSRPQDVRYYRHRDTGITLRIDKGGKIPENTGAFYQIDTQWVPHDVIIMVMCRFLIPFVQLFALYVIGHGHHSPGGGFQGGVILGAAVILFAVSRDLRSAIRRFSEKTVAYLLTLGVAIYAGTGALCLLMGGNFLDYGALAGLLGTDPITARSHGILIVEIGVGLAVMAVMVSLYYNLSSAGKQDEGL